MTEAANSKKRLVLIDGKSVFYRGYYAMPGLSTKDGTSTGGVYGFTVLSMEVIKRLKPDYVAVAWDKPKTNIRKRLKIYPNYKAGRKPAPADFYTQIPILHELLQALSWPLYELDDYEADDIMAGLAKKADKAGLETILITSDLDALQCISNDTKVFALKKGLSNIEEFHSESFEAKYGIRTDQFLDLKALQGDSSDNIPGVPGVGQKTAVNLLQKYENLDGIYENIDLIDGNIHDKLVAGKDSAYMSKEVATLFTDAPIELDLEAMDVKKFDPSALRTKLEELEFKSLIRQLPEVEAAESKAEAVTVNSISNSMLPKLLNPEKADFEKANELYVYARSKGAHGKDPLLIVAGTDKWITILEPKFFEHYKKYFEKPLIGYDLKSSLKTLYSLGAENLQIGHDVQIGAFLINSLDRTLGFSELADRLGIHAANLHDIPTEDIGEFAAEYVAALVALNNEQQERLKTMQSVQELADTIEWPVIPVIAKIERRGIDLDVKYLEKMSTQLAKQIKEIEKAIYEHVEHEFNISSPQQLAVVLFDELGLPTTGIKKGKTGYSTAANELDKLRAYHPVINQITQYRELTKLKSTYVDTLPELVDSDGRLHTTFNMTVAQTGRLSSADPNLQNIPVRSELGKSIRTGFVAKKDHTFVSADYSQFELRLAAVMAGDTDMVEVFNSGADIHTRTAAEVYGVALDDVTREMRSNAKTINFGVLYGMSPHGLAIATGMTFGDAKEFIDRYFASRQPLVDYIAKLKKQAKEEGYVETLFGRRRPTPDVKSANFILREAAYRQAVNMPIQGTEADLMKMAMIAVDKKLPKDCVQLLQIHDSILVECPETRAKDVAEILKDTMENIYPKLGITLSVDVHSGKNWGEL